MALLTVIGRGVRVRGRITGEADLTIEGHVEGEVAVTGNVTIDSEGVVGASVSGHVVVVRGAVKGDLTGTDAVRLEEGARVVGAVRAPRIGIARGALVRGHVQTGNAHAQTASRSKAHDTAHEAPPGRQAARHAAPPRIASVKHAPAMASRTIPAPPPAAAVKIAAKGPPPPTVPALRKGAKGALKKKAR
jgi:cytoskeletal protein CcmA (bactofilin family)